MSNAAWTHALLSRRVLWISLVILSGWILAGVLRMNWQPLLMDEMDFIVAARGWPQHGGAVPHPPGYVHLLRLLFSLFGEHNIVARLPGILGALASLWLLPALVRSVFPKQDHAALLALISVWLFGLSPLTVQNAMLVDIDNTIMLPMLMITFMLWIAHDPHGGWKRTGLMAVWIGVLLWIKFPPVLLFLAGAGMNAIWERDLRRLGPLILTAVLGGVLFAVTFGLESWSTGFGWEELRGTFQKAELLWQVRRVLVTLPQTLGVFIMWLTLPMAFLTTIGFVRALKKSSGAGRSNAPAIAWFVAVATVFYSYINGPSYGFPKYQSILLPYLCLLAAWVVLEAWRVLPKLMIGLALAVFGVSWLLQTWMGDPLYRFYRVTALTSVSELGSRGASAGLAVLAASLPEQSALLAGIVAATVGRLRFGQVTTVLLCAAFFGQAISTKAAQEGATYSTRYHYGSEISKYFETCGKLETSLGPGSYVIAPKDIVYRTGFPGRFVNEILREDLKPDSLLAVLAAEDVRALVLTPREETRAGATLRDPRVRGVLEREFIPQRIGEYLLFLKAPQ